jgi:hypothetical protein
MLIAEYLYDSQYEDYEVRVIRNTHGKYKCTQNIGRKTWRQDTIPYTPSLDGRIIQSVQEKETKIRIRKNVYYTEEVLSPFSGLKFQVLFILVSMFAHAPSPWFTSRHGDSSAEGVWHFVAGGVSFDSCMEVLHQAATPLRGERDVWEIWELP